MSIHLPSMLATPPIQFWTVLGLDTPKLVGVSGRERLSRPYAFRLRMRTETVMPIDLNRLAGSPTHIRIRLPDSNLISGLLSASETRDFCGILSQVSYDGVDDHFTYYSATLRPRFWTLGLNRTFRFFSQQTTKDIVTSVLPSDMAVDWRLSSDLSASDSCYRNYCVQYGESDLTFVNRLLEEDGLFYFFEHQYETQPADPAEHVEKLVITDHIAPVADAEIPIYTLDSDRGGIRESSRIRQWRESRFVVPEVIDSVDRHFQRPGAIIKSVYLSGESSPSNDATATPESSITGEAKIDNKETSSAALPTLTHYPSGVARRYDDTSPGGGDQVSQLEHLDTTADRDARIKTQRLALDREIYSGAGDVATLTPTATFRLLRGLATDTNAYYVTDIQHRIQLATNVRSGDDTQKLTYRNRFHCHPVSLPYRAPRRTRKPRVKGVVPATVVSDLPSADDQLCVDKYGRVKVFFPWQTEDKQPSCWIRVSQFWAGPRWGAFFWPRVGHEVLVGFEHGDPDRPVIVGSVYNSANMPPLTLPEHKLSCGIHSCSHNGDPIQNTSCVVFHDKRGNEFLQLHSETYASISSETKSLTWSSGEDITFSGHHWLFDPSGNSSGGGGSDSTGDNDGAVTTFKESDSRDDDGSTVLEFVKELFSDFNDGTVEYGVGDSFSKQFGRNLESYFGCNIWLGCDPVEVFEWAASKAASPIPSFLIAGLLGAAGQGTTLFGGTHDIQYGTKVDVHRGGKIEKQCPSAIGAVEIQEKGNSTPIDAPAACVCEAVVAIILLLDFAVMLLMRLASNHETSAWNGFLKFGKAWSLYILPRVQGLIEVAETTLGRLDVATEEAESTLEQSEDALKRSVRAMVTTDGTAGVSVEAAESEIEIALDSIRNALKRAKESVAALLGMD